MNEITQSDASPTNRSRVSVFKSTNRFVAYWFKLIAQPLLAIVFVVGLAWFFGFAQRNFNWFNDAATSVADSEAEDKIYACSMLCVLVKAPGRCPVCGMVLEEVEVTGDPKDLYGVTIDPTARRLANITTVAALNLPVSREIKVLGKVVYDETTESTITAYVDGRVENLMVDFTGAKVKKGDALAVLYSPDLYADQVGLLSAKKDLEESPSSNPRIKESNRKLYESTRRRLIEFGIPEAQINEIERRGKPESRIRVISPMSGTVVEKTIKQGSDVKKGMPLLKVADLSKVWLVLEIYPEVASDLRIGQPVMFTIQSQVGQKFEGRISFIDPVTNPVTNAVNVRVEVPNDAGLIKIGDFGNARIELKRRSTDDLVIVPRDSVLINGPDSIAYVETKPGRFEFRKVEIAEIMGDKISLSDGIEPGEMVAASGVFMLDSTFNIQGKVSLIDPNRAERMNQAKLADNAEAREIEEAFSKLNADDRKLAEEQVICPVNEIKLGSSGMGTPIRVSLPGRDVMICCEGCRKRLVADPEKYFSILDDFKTDAPTAEELAEIKKSFAPLSAADRKLAEEQVICPVTEVRLGTEGMGTPIRVDVNGTPVMICCEGCRKGLLKEPEKHFQILEDYHKGKKQKLAKKASKDKSPSNEIPQMDLPRMDLPNKESNKKESPRSKPSKQENLPQMELPK